MLGLLERLGDVDAVVDARPVVVGADDDLAHPQFDQRLRVLDAPLAGAVGVGGGEDAEPSRRVDVLLALDDQQGLLRVRGEDGGDRRQVEQQRHPLGPAARPLLRGLVEHLAAESLLPRLGDEPGLGPGVGPVGVLIGVAVLLVGAVAADMRSRQAALDQMVADGLEMLGVAVLRPAVKQDAARVGDGQHQRRIVRAARLVNRAAAEDAAVAFNRAADRLGDVLCGDVFDVHGSPRRKSDAPAWAGAP